MKNKILNFKKNLNIKNKIFLVLKINFHPRQTASWIEQMLWRSKYNRMEDWEGDYTDPEIPPKKELSPATIDR